MPEAKKRTYNGVYDALNKVSQEEGIDFGLENYSPEDFKKKYFTGPGNISNLYNKLSQISDEEGIDFGLGTQDEWLASFGYRRRGDNDYETLDGKRVGGKSQQQVMSDAQQTLGENQRTINRISNRQQRIGLDTGPRVQIGGQGWQLGQNRKVTQGQQRFNPSTGQMEQTYITPSGNEYGTRGLADLEQNARDIAERPQTVSNQLEEAYAERERLTKLMQQRIEQLEEGEDNRPWYLRMAGSASAADKMADGASPVNRWENDEEYIQLMAAARKNDELITTLEDRQKGDTNSFWHSLATDIANGYNFSLGGKAQMEDMRAMVDAQKHIDSINKKREKGEELTAEELTAEAFLKNAEWDQRVQAEYGDQYGAWARAGKMGAKSADFMLDFLMMGGAPISLARGVMNGIVKMGGEYAAKGFGKYMLKATGATLGSMVSGAMVTNTVQLGKTSSDVAQTMLGDVYTDPQGNYVFGHFDENGKFVNGGEDFLTSLAEVERAGIAENGSEVLGSFLPGADKILKGLGLSRIARGLTALKGKKWYANYSNFLKTSGFNGVPGEGLEEYGGTFLDFLMGGDEYKNLADLQTHVDIWLGVTTMGAMLNGPKMVGAGYSAIQHQRYKKATSAADIAADTTIGTDKWSQLRETIDGTPNEGMSDVVVNILNNNDLNDDAKRAAMEYIYNLQKMRGYSLGSVAADKNDDGSEEEDSTSAEINQSYTEGYDTQEPDDMKKIVDEAEAARSELEQYGKEFAKMIEESDPVEGINYLLTLRDDFYTDEQIAAAADYYQKQYRALGVLDAQSDKVDLEVEQANAEVRSNTHQQSGNVVTATVNDEEVYVIGGEIVTDPNTGLASLAGTGGAVVVKNPVTGQISVKSPQEVVIQSVQNADDLIQQNETTLRQQLVQQADDNITFGSPANEVYDMEDQVSFQDGNGNVVNGMVVQLPNAVDGAYIIQTDDNKILQMTADDLNRRIVAHNGMQVERASAQPVQQQADEDVAQPAEQQGGTLDNAGGEAGAENGTGADNPPATAISRIPVATDEKGQPILKKGRPQYLWHQVSVEDATDALIETTGGDKLMARDTAKDLIDVARDKLEKIRKQKPKGEDPIEIAESRMAIRQQETEQQAIIKQWQQVNQRIQNMMQEESAARQAAIEAAKSEEQRQREAEEARIAKEKQEEQDRKRLREQIEKDKERRNKQYEPLVQARKDMADDAEALAILGDTEPRSLDEFVSSLLRPHSMLWQDVSDSEIGLQTELGLKRNDMQRMMSLLGTKESGAKPFGQVVLDIHEGLPQGMKEMYTDADVRNTLLDLFNEGSSTRMLHLTEEHRIEEARNIYAENKRREAEAELEAWAEAYHLTPEERETFEDFMQQAPSLPEQEIINQIIADNEQNRTSPAVGEQPVSGTAAGSIEGGEGQIQQAAEAAGNGDNAQAADQESEATAGQPSVADNDVPGTAQDREVLAVLFDQIGANPVLAERMSDFDVEQLTALVEDWEIANDEYGQVIEQTKNVLSRKRKPNKVKDKEYDEAKAKVDEAQAKANEIFEPIAEYVEGLNAKYGIESEQPFEGAIPTPQVDKPRYDANRKALIDAYKSGDPAAITAAAQAIQQYVDEGLDNGEDNTEMFDIAEDYDGNDPEKLADQYIIRTFWDRYLDDDVDQEYIKTGLKPAMRQSEQKELEVLRDAVAKHTSKYNTLAPIEIVDIDSDYALKEAYKSITGEELTDEEIPEACQELKDSKHGWAFGSKSKKIYIFAQLIDLADTEEALFHEAIHRGLQQYYGDNLVEVAEAFWDTTSPTNPSATEKHKENIAEAYKDKPEDIKEEYLVNLLSHHMVKGSVGRILSRMTPEHQEIINNILHNIRYDTAEETRQRNPEEAQRLEAVRQEPRQDNGNGGGIVSSSSEKPKKETNKPAKEHKRIVSDEKMEDLRKQLLAKFNNMNEGIDVERMLLGAMYAVGKIERGVTKFADYAAQMVDEIGDAIRPYLKSFYNAVRDMPEAAPYRDQMDSAEYVDKFDVFNFDKQKQPTAIEKAEQVVKQQKAKKQVKKIIQEQPTLWDDMFAETESQPTEEEKAEPKREQQPQRKTAWWSDPNRPQSLDPSDYHTYITDEAKAYFAQFKSEDGKTDFTKAAHPNLAYITAAAWDGANIPLEELMRIAEIQEAESRVKEKEDREKFPTFRISKQERRELAARLLDDEHGSAVFENGKIKKVNDKEVFTGPVRQEKKAFVVVGRPAGGKSSVFANRLSHDNGARIVDSDVVKPWLSGYDEGYGAGYVQLASADVASSALKKASDAGDNIVLPRIGGGSVMDEVIMLREKGYDVQIFFNEVSEQTSIMRAASRFAQEGRYLSLDYLTQIKDKDSKSFRTFVGKKIGDYYEQIERTSPSARSLPATDILAGRGNRPGNQDEDLRRGDFGRGGSSDVPGVVSETGRFGRAGQERPAGTFEEELIFSYAEWKSNDVAFGEKPKEIWNSKSGKPMPTKKGKNNDARDLQQVGEENRRGHDGVSSGKSSVSRSVVNSGLESDLQERRDERQGDTGVSQGDGTVSGSTAGQLRPVQGLSQQQPAQPKQAPKHNNKRNNSGERGKDYAPTSPKARFNANVEAIKMMRELIDQGIEAPTKDQMEVLRQYSGWGGLGTYFNDESSAENKILRDLLDDEEYNDAVMSINSAYYTPATVIDTLWDVAKAMGFKGGNVLEGSAGIGNIIGQMPKDMSRQSNIEAVEIDKISGNILKLLYPDAKVHIQGFQDTVIRNGSVDLAVTNVPFVTGLHVIDKVDKDLSRRFVNIHDFCIAKNIRKLREGGIGIFITSSGTLDKSTDLRAWITDEGQADVVGAFRLNNETFGGTKVTSDIIVIRKRIAGRTSEHSIDVSKASPVRVGTYEDKLHNEHQATMVINDYFKEHPEMMAGEMAFGYEKDDTFRPGSYGLYPAKGKDQDKMMAQFVKSMEAAKEEREPVGKTTGVVVEPNQLTAVKEGRMLIDDKGRLCVSRYGEAVPLGINDQKVKGQTKQQCFKDYQAVQAAVDDVLQQQLSDPNDEALKPKLAALNKAYDLFTKRYGTLHKNTAISFLRNDIDFPSFQALEIYKEEKDIKGNVKVTTSKPKLFSERVIGFKTEPQPKTVKDAVIASIFRTNGIDLEWIANKLNEVAAPPHGDKWTADDVRKGVLVSRLGFEDPSTGQLEIRYKYLSGNVREKLAIAEQYNTEGETAGRYAANVEELRKVVPMDIPAHLIDFSLGSSWIPVDLYKDFVKETLDLENVRITHLEGSWAFDEGYSFRNEKNRAAGVYSEKFRETIYGHQLVAAALNNRPVKVAKQVSEGYGSSKTTHTEVDQAATQACAVRVDEIKDEFKQWAKKKMQDDPELGRRIEKLYNEKFNALVPMEIGDEFLPEIFEGANQTLPLYNHQKRGVMRGVVAPTMLAHEVGTGKSFTLITTAMEMRRLGTAKKPMIVVQNATVAQMTADAKLLYPNAKVLSLSEQDRDAEGRRAFYAKIKYNDWDIIIVPQSTFERIPDSPERELQFIQEKIDEKKHVIEAAQAAGVDGQDLKRLKRELEKIEQEYGDVYLDNDPANQGGKKKKKDAKREAASLDKAETRAKEQLDRAVDDVQYFDDLGVDALLVDEAHEYKHLGFQTSIGRGIKGIDPSYSKKCAGLYNKTRSVFEKAGWKNVVFATGTPISNTAAEIWTFMKYLMPADVMKANDIYYFDDFVHNFGSISQMLEFATNGKFKENTRFAAYVNKPELIRIWSQVADTVLTKEVAKVQEKIPKQEGDKDQDMFLPQSPSLIRIMTAVRKELERFENMSGQQKKENSSIPLTMYGVAKRAAIDPRLVDAEAPDEPLSKTNAAVKEIVKDLKATQDYKGTVAVFCDNQNRLGVNAAGKKVVEFNIYDDMKEKLIKAGVPEKQIAIIKSGMSITAKQKIFDAVNSGDIRVVLGSTQTLGTGVNMQERLHLLIHMDAPDRPMDYTQRNGRIKRQGNLHKNWGKTIRVIRFGVEDSLDVTAYQRLKTKSGFIDSIMDGKAALANNQIDRTVEEEEEGLFDNPVAVLSGSQYALKKNQAERELRKYQGKKAQWEADQIYVTNQLRYNDNQLKATEANIKEEQKKLEHIKSMFPDGTVKTITVEGVKIDMTKDDGAKKLGDALKEKINDPVNAIVKRNRENAIYNDELLKYTISLDGHDIIFTIDVFRESVWDNGKMKTVIHKFTSYSMPSLEIDAMASSRGVRDYLDEIIDQIVTGQDSQDRIDAMQKAAERIKSETEQIKQREGMPFQYDKELAEARKNVEEYTELMKKEMKEKEAKYAAQQKEAEADGKGFDLSKAEDEEDDDERYRDQDVFAEGESFPINTTMGYSSYNVLDRAATYSTDLLPDAYTSHEEMLDAIRRQYPAYYARIEDGQVVMESWQHVFGASSAARQRKDKGSKNYIERKTRNAINAVQSLAKQMHLDVEVLTTTDGLEGKKARAKGWFNRKTGKITLVLPNHSSQGDLINTLLHEGVAHYGLRHMFGQHFDTFLDNVYNNVSPEIKARIDAAMKRNKWSRHEATEEYLARLAEQTDFEHATRMGWWQKIKDFFMNMLANVGLVMDEPLTDNELRYILWRSYDNLLHPDRRRNIFDKARDVQMQSRLRVGPYSERERQRIQRTGRIDTSRIAAEKNVPMYAEADVLIDDVQNSNVKTVEQGLSIGERVSELPQSQLVYAYNKVNGMMLDEDGLNVDEHNEKVKSDWIKEHGLEDVGKAMADDLKALMDKYGEGMLTLRWELLDRIEDLGIPYEAGRTASEGDRVNEEMLNPDFEGKSSQELLLSLSQKDENGRNETINELVRRVREGDARIVRMGQEVELDRESDAQIAGTIIAGWQQLRLSEPSDDLLGGMVQSSSPVDGNPSRQDIAPDYKLALISWARANGHYISEEEVKRQSLDKDIFGTGAESNVYRTADGTKVIKFIKAEDNYYQNPLLKRMDGIVMFNAAGFEPMSVLGYSLDERNFLRVVVEQDFVDGVTLDEVFEDRTAIEENNYIDTLLEDELGLERHIDEEGILCHVKDGVVYKDIHGGNVILDRQRKHRVIDCYVSLQEDDKKERTGDFTIEDEADEMGLLYRDDDAWVDDVAKEAYEKAVAQDGVKLKEAWQDSMVALKLIQNAIAKETGRVATGAEDAYNFENRMHGRAKNMTEQYDWNYYRPMLKTFAAFCKEHGYTQEQGLEYLISKSGLERNMYYAMQSAVREQLTEDAKKQREQLEKDYAKGKITEQHYKDKKAEIEDMEKNGVDDAIKAIKDKFLWKKAQEDYDNGQIDYGEMLRRREMVIGSVAPKYAGYAHDYSGLTETFAKEMYDSAQEIKKEAQRAIDPQERRMLWSEYDEAMRQAYEVAREYALDAVFSGEHGDFKETSTKLWSTINAATEETLKQSYESGMMDRNTYNKVRGMFDYYIPLRGWDEDKASDVYTYMGKDNVFSPAIKKTWGRTSKAENPLAYIGNIAVSTIIAGHRNLMKQHFLNYVMNNPTSLVSISESWYENMGSEDDHPVWILRSADTAGKSGDELAQIINDFNEEMRQKQREGKAMPVTGRLRLDVHATSGQKNEHVVEVQRAGHTYQLYINGNPKAAQALNGSAARAVSRISDTWLGKKITNLNRNMAMFFTSKNPAFVISNLSRDLNMAGASVAINEGPKYNARFVANVMKVLAPRMGESSRWMPASKQPTGLMPSLMRKWQNGTLDESNETERLFKEFMTEGGETGFVNMLSIDSFKEKMQKEIREMNGSSLTGAKGAKETSIHKGLRLLGDTFEFYNRCAEDATRFIVYMTSRQMGKTLEESIADAKNVTLNFNRKGTGAMGNAEVRDLFIFVNPAIQALANMYRMAKGHPLKFGAVTAAFVAGGALIPIINQWIINMFGDDDDKDSYWNLPPWVRKNNLVFWVPGTKSFVTIPLSQEFRVFYGIGEMASSLAMEHPINNWELELFSSVADLVPINPTGNGGNLLVDFSPTMVQPIMQIGENVDFTGKPIWRDNQGNKYDPMFAKAYVSTPKWMTKISEGINYATGGDQDSRGWLERTTAGTYLNNPAVWNHLLQGYFGGMYNTIAKTFDVIATAASGEMPKIYQTPIINRFLNRPVERDNAGALGEDYWQLVNEMEETQHNINAKRKRAADGDEEAKIQADELMESSDGKRADVIRHYKSIIDDLRKGERSSSDKEEKKQFKESIAMYKQQMLEELQAIDAGVDPLEAAMQQFDKATKLEERKKLQNRIKRLTSNADRTKGHNADVEKAKRYLDSESDEPGKAADYYLKLATSADIKDDARITAAKARAKVYADHLKQLETNGKGEEAAAYRQANAQWLAAHATIKNQSRLMSQNKKLLGKGHDQAVMKLIANNRNAMLKAIEGLPSE